MVTSAATPSAPSAAAVNEVAIEKKITVPPWAVARIAPPSQPGTSTQTIVMSAGPPAARTAQETATGSRASAITTSSARPSWLAAAVAARSVAASCSRCTTPMMRPAPARRAADVKDGKRERDRQVARQHGGDGPAEQDRVSVAGHLLGPAVPAGQPVGHRKRREAERDERGYPVPRPQAERRAVARLLDDPGEHPAGAGDRVMHLPAAGDDRRDRRPDRVGVAIAGRVQLPEGRRVEV